MAVWLVRAGAHGEYEQKFIEEKRVYVTWDLLDVDLAALPDRAALTSYLGEHYVDVKPKTITNWVSQIWPFAHDMAVGDLVIVPLKTQPAIQVGEITGEYRFESKGPSPYYHWRSVKWIGDAIPRANFGQDLLFSFGAFLTICRIQRNNAEARIAAMRHRGWQAETGLVLPPRQPAGENVEPEAITDIDLLAQDQIAHLINSHFKGHNLTRLVDAILRAQGYTTYVSPEGADGGVDILAGAGPLGFGAPRLCVEVKSESGAIDRPTVDKLLGAVAKFGADEGLFVAWGGFKSTVPKELAPSFFKVRLWNRNDLLQQLFETYDRLDEDIRAELPLKRIWTVASQDED